MISRLKSTFVVLISYKLQQCFTKCNIKKFLAEKENGRVFRTTIVLAGHRRPESLGDNQMSAATSVVKLQAWTGALTLPVQSK